MRKLLLIMFLFAFLEGKTQTIHRVTTGMSLQTEITNAPNGDIFYAEGGIVYENLEINKKVTIFGTGYFLSNNQASPGESKVGQINLKPGSDGSYITGLHTMGSINIWANNVVIQRCYVDGEGRLRLGYNATTGQWTGTANNCILIQNYAQRPEILTNTILSSTASVSNFVVKGNIFYRYGFHLQGNISGEITNNTFMPGVTPLEAYYSIQNTNTGYPYNNICTILPVSIKNNIMPNIGYECPITSNVPTVFSNNVFNQNFTNLPSSNVINADANALFVGYPTNPNNALTPDARCQLASNSAAKGAGEGGTDAGAFGGDTPYVLSGIPIIPNIYQLTVPLQVPQGGTLNVQIKAKTNN